MAQELATYQDELRKRLLDYLSSTLKEIDDKQLISILLDFFKDYFSSLTFCQRDFYKRKDAIKYLVKVIVKNTPFLDDFSWDNYCIQMTELKSSKSPYLSKWLLSRFYNIVAEKTNNEMLLLIRHLFLSDEVFITGKDKRTLMVGDLLTNFPIGSKSSHIYQLKRTSLGSNEFYYTNVNFNTENEFVYRLMEGFLLDIETNYGYVLISNYSFRAFLYFFEDSLGETSNSIARLNSFTKNLFFSQYDYFAQLDEKITNTSNLTTTNLLKKFYLYIDRMYLKENSIHLFDLIDFNYRQISSSNYIQSVLEGYEFVYRSPHESVPESDKWVMLPDLNRKTASASRNVNAIIDFTKVEDEICRDELKQYIWFKPTCDWNVRFEAPILIEFINTAHHLFSNNVTPLHENKEMFPTDFILQYRVYVELRASRKYGKGDDDKLSPKGINNVLTALKNYLRYCQKIGYHIKEMAFQQLKSIKLEKGIGGNPFTNDDFNHLQEAFRNNCQDLKGKLFFIIFQLSTMTKLRQGEIISLERDCIVSKNRALRIGQIKYISKTSNGDEVIETLLLEDIELIEEAINLTEQIVEHAPLDYKKYIFLIESFHFKGQVEWVPGNLYATYFNDIADKLGVDYRPYNSRHTYIDTAYQALEDDKISSLQVTAITGNTKQVARDHYRKYEVKRYLEATHMITVGDVTNEGRIIVNEIEIKGLQQVEDGAGACQSEVCIKIDIDDIDTDYKCLKCKKFVTTIDRIPIFEDRLKHFIQMKENVEYQEIKNYYEGFIKLYSAYLTEMILKTEE